MKYSLRSMMIVVTLFCVGVVFTVRAIPLLRRAKDHDELARRLDQISDGVIPATRMAVEHRKTAEAWRRAAWQPWTTPPSELDP